MNQHHLLGKFTQGTVSGKKGINRLGARACASIIKKKSQCSTPRIDSTSETLKKK